MGSVTKACQEFKIPRSTFYEWNKAYNKEGKGMPFLQGKTEFGELYPDFKLFCSDPIKIALEGDILISVRAPVGDLNIASRKCCIGRGLAAIRPNKAFLYHLYP